MNPSREELLFTLAKFPQPMGDALADSTPAFA
jgi:hypothetical protein